MTESLPLRQQIVFFKRLATMTRAGIPLPEGLHMICTSEMRSRRRDVLRGIERSIREGHTLAHALESIHGVSTETRTLVCVGERSGSLSYTLATISETLKKRREMYTKIRSALIYPCVILVATFCITIFLAVYLFPKLTPIFKSMHTVLPVSTRIVLFVSTMLTEHGILLLVSGGVVVSALILCSRLQPVRHGYDRVVSRVPIIRALVHAYEIATSARIAATLLRSGMPIVEVNETLAKASHSIEYRTLFVQCAEAVREGKTTSSVLHKNARLVPSTVVHLVATGESTGTLAESFDSIAEEYEHDITELTKDMTTLIEPILMITMGLVVGFVALSIIAPIYQLTQSMHG